ncbi:hypothetical protein [Treponema sp.]|uniref:hypothetical protein n=1 Tax=Treponema sp. TaxID=166 RepID=UPI00298DB74B|nr:hypothetical protein [Treponema sp.]MCR5612641.1 hypothetical protein [Treponema sp.]
MPDIEFTKQVIQAVDTRVAYYNSDILPQILEKYRLIHTCVKNIIDVLIQRSLIKPDPYKHEKKISDVEIIPNEQYIDSERSLVIGTRLSDYEAILDFICTYYKFSIEGMTFAKIKKFVEFNNTFNWHSFSTSSSQANTRGFACLVAEAKHGAPAMTSNMMTDGIVKCDSATRDINIMLKELSEFQKEVYKAYIRKDIFDHPKFDKNKANESAQAEQAEIKRLFPAVMGKTPYYTALIEEITKEDNAPDKAKLQAAVLEKLKIKEQRHERKEKKVDSKEVLLQAIHALSGIAPQLEVVVSKINENHSILESEHQSFWARFLHNLRKAFNIEEPPVTYSINITDSTTGTVTREKLVFQAFVANIEKRINFYNSFSVRQAPGFQKIEKNEPEKILEFLNKQIAEVQRLLVQLNALDEFFKTTANADNKKNIKGLKMELTSLKNSIVNTNQHRVDYISVVEEQVQMKKLGITDEEN